MQAREFTGGCSAHLCEALYAGSRAKQASESLLNMTQLFNEEVYISKGFTQWVSSALYPPICCHGFDLFL